MKLDFALLADAATGLPDGKLYVHGGGITRIAAPVVPWPQPSLALVLRFMTGPEDWGQVTKLKFSLEDPDGASVLPPAEVSTEVATPVVEVEEGEDTAFQVVLNLGGGVLFPRLGLFTFRVSIDDKEVKELPLAVVAAPPPDSPPSPSSAA